MKKMIPLTLLLFVFSCITKNNSNTDSDSTKSLKIIKFMGIGMYSHEIDKKLFWTYDDEHMLMYMKKGGFLSDIETYRETETSMVKEYIYAFVTPTDTLYSDYSLKSWILIRKKKEKYFYDESGKTANFLKRYPFFRDCPYIPDSK